MDRDGSLELAIGQHLDQAVALLQQSEVDELLERELLLIDVGDVAESENCVFNAEDVGEAALGEAAVP
jgi:hypothetical protein